jgi:hypothetical protein
MQDSFITEKLLNNGREESCLILEKVGKSHDSFQILVRGHMVIVLEEVLAENCLGYLHVRVV